jgi:hypothetical protein
MARAKAKDNLKIAVAQFTDGDERTITVTIVAKATEFTLPDLLSDQETIDSYADRLSKAAKEATEGYFQEANDAVAMLTARKQRQMSGPERPPKPKDAGKEAGQKRIITPAETGPAPGVRTSPERVNGPVTG